MTRRDDREIPRHDWAVRVRKPQPDRTGPYRPDKTVEYLTELDYRPKSRH